MNFTTKTDKKWKQLKYRSEVPLNILKSEFDYQDEEEIFDGFFCYRGHWYHTDQFFTIGSDNPLANAAGIKWNGYLSDSFYSGILVELSNDGESYRVATYNC